MDNGESFEITNYGRVVALLVPPPTSPLEILRAAGKVQSAQVEVEDVLRMHPLRIAGDSTAELDAIREDR